MRDPLVCTGSGAAGSVVADSAHPCEASLPLHHDHRLRELPLLLVGKNRMVNSAKVSSEKAEGIAAEQQDNLLELLFALSLSTTALSSRLPGCCLGRDQMNVHGAVRRLVCAPDLHLDSVELVAAMPCDSPAWCLLFGCYEAAAVARFLHLASHWDTAWQGAHKSVFPNFFDIAHSSLTAFTIRRGVEVARDYVCTVFLGDPLELAQQPHGNVTPLDAPRQQHTCWSPLSGGLLNFDLTIMMSESLLQLQHKPLIRTYLTNTLFESFGGFSRFSKK